MNLVISCVTCVFEVETNYFNLVALNEMRSMCGNLKILAGGKSLASVASIFATITQK